VTEDKTVPAPTNPPTHHDDRRYTILVRFPDLPRALRITPDGHTTNRKAHAAILTRAEAEKALGATRPYLDAHHPGATAWMAPF
jgi:hypothetical protein